MQRPKVTASWLNKGIQLIIIGESNPAAVVTEAENVKQRTKITE